MKNLDDEIKKALEKNIRVTEKDKQEIWNNIDNEISKDVKRGDLKKMKSSKKRYMPLIATAAAVMIIFAGTQTKVGHAIISQIKEMFVPEKQITQEIEGNKEKTDVNLQHPSNSEYVIYIDEERYKFIEGEESDKIVMKDIPDGDFPEVSMEIKQVADKAPEEVVNELATQIKEEYETFYEPKMTNEPIDSWTVRGVDGHEWNSPIINVYVVSNEDGGSFIITQRYFLEAAEGHGARFYQMLKEFHIVDNSLENN